MKRFTMTLPVPEKADVDVNLEPKSHMSVTVTLPVPVKAEVDVNLEAESRLLEGSSDDASEQTKTVIGNGNLDEATSELQTLIVTTEKYEGGETEQTDRKKDTSI